MSLSGNEPLTRRWLGVMLLGLSLNLAGCMTKPVVVVLPDSRLLKAVYDEHGQPVPDYYGISAGYLREILRDLEACR